MALTLNANWLAEARKGASEPRFLFTIYLGGVNVWNMTSGKCDNMTYPEAVAKVSGVSRSIDPVTRKVSIKGINVVLPKTTKIRSMVTTYGVMGAYCETKIGFAPLVEGDFEDYFVGIVSEVKQDDQRVTLVIKGMERKIADVEIWPLGSNDWNNEHPLTVIEEMLENTNMSGDWYDSTSLDPATYQTSIKHYVVSRFGSDNYKEARNLTDPISATDLIDELAAGLGGTFTSQEDGKFYFHLFDTTNASVADLTVDDFGPDLSIDDLYGTLINQVITRYQFRLGQGESGLPGSVDAYQDSASMSTFGTTSPGGAEINVQDHELDFKWVNGMFRLETEIENTDTEDDTFTIVGEDLHAVCGTRWANFPSGSQAVTDKLNSNRLAIFKFGKEMLSVKALVIDDSWVQEVETFDPLGDGITYTYKKVMYRATCTIKARSLKGTAAATHPVDLEGFDITMPYTVADTLLRRFSNGAWKLKVRLGLEHYAIQLMDFVTVTTDRFVAKGHDGLDTTSKFEVTGKHLDLMSNPPKLELTLVYATTGAPPTKTDAATTFRRRPRSWINALIEAAENADVSEKHIISGLTMTTGAAFNATIAAGVGSAGGMGRNRLSGARTYTQAASKAVWFYQLAGFDGLLYITTGSGDAEPSPLPTGATTIGKAVSDGAGAMTLTDRRDLRALNGGKLVAETVDTGQIADKAIEASNMGLDEHGEWNNRNPTLTIFSRG